MTNCCTKLQSTAVVDALIKLLDDPDPNIRAIAAISLGRTGTKEKKVINHLLILLDDKDRICRQSACLSLGHIKAEEGVPKISHLWYVRQTYGFNKIKAVIT